MGINERISAEHALRDIAHGALLICGYDNDEKWQAARVPGAVSYMDFASHMRELPKDAELMFYCA